jgi:hypothetical protein
MIDLFAKTIIPGQQGTYRHLTTRVFQLFADSGQMRSPYRRTAARNCYLMIFARWEWWGIPSAWCSPTPRCPGGQQVLSAAGRACQACPGGSAW